MNVADAQKSVAEQLAEVRKVGLAKLDLVKYSTLELEHLELAARKVPGYRRTFTKSLAITRLLKHEIPQIEVPGCVDLLNILFGLKSELAGNTPDELRTKAANAAKNNRRNFSLPGRQEDQLLEILAAQIVADCLGSSQVVTSKPLYVDRRSLREEYERANASLIVFYGLAGMGKTWLAQELVRLSDGSPAPIIRVGGGEVHLPDVQGALSRFNISADRSVDGSSQSLLIVLLNDNNAPDHVVLDGLDSADELRHLLPADDTRSVVVATCRMNGDHSPEHGVYIRVDKLDDDEGIELVRRRLPSVSDEDAELLENTAGGYPLVLRYMCALVANVSVSVPDICREINVEAVEVARRIPTTSDANLLAVLHRLIGIVLARSEHAYVALIITTFAGGLIQAGAYRPVLERQLALMDSAPSAHVKCADALKVLLDVAIVDITETDYVVLHSLTRRIFRDLFSDNLRDLGLATVGLDEFYTERANNEWTAEDMYQLHKEETYASWHVMNVYCAWIEEMHENTAVRVSEDLQAHIAKRVSILILMTNEIVLKDFGNSLPAKWVNFSRRIIPGVWDLMREREQGGKYRDDTYFMNELNRRIHRHD